MRCLSCGSSRRAAYGPAPATRPRPASVCRPGHRYPGTQLQTAGGGLVTQSTDIDYERVLCGEADQSLVAEDGCGQAEEDQVVAGMAPVAWGQAAVAGQPGDGALDHPAVAAQPLFPHWSYAVRRGVNRSGIVEVPCVDSSRRSRLELSVVVRLVLVGWDVSDRCVEALVVEPVHPFSGREFDAGETVSGLAGLDQLRFAESGLGFHERVADGADPSVDTGLEEVRGERERRVPTTRVRLMRQPLFGGGSGAVPTPPRPP